jgi:hypothetical protein
VRSFDNTGAKRPSGLVQTEQIRDGEWLLSVLLNQGAQFVACVNAGRFRPSLYQACLGVLVLSEKDRLAQRFGVHHNKAQLEQDQQMPFVRSQ